jgi:hypothetical protein
MAFHAPTAFRKLLDGPDVIIRAAVSGPLMARIAQDVGFTSLALGGFAVEAQSCRPEPLLDLTQLAWDAAAVQRSVDLPIIVDVDPWQRTSHQLLRVAGYALGNKPPTRCSFRLEKPPRPGSERVTTFEHVSLSHDAEFVHLGTQFGEEQT